MSTRPSPDRICWSWQTRSTAFPASRVSTSPSPKSISETVGLEVTVEGEQIDASALVKAIERVGAAVHSIDELVVGTHIVERVPRTR